MIYESKYFAFAKINLTLNVIGKRPDGYHELESIMQAVSLCDDVTVRLELKEGDGLQVCVHVDTQDEYILTQSIPGDGQNTAHKAVKAFFARQKPGNGASVPFPFSNLRTRNANKKRVIKLLTPRKARCERIALVRPGEPRFAGPIGVWGLPHINISINIKKRIPAAAGLAGGSADAAAVLRALNDIAGCLQGENGFAIRRFSENELLAAALDVGADVPFCLLCGTARAGAGAGQSGDNRGESASPVYGNDIAKASGNDNAKASLSGTAFARGVGELLSPLSNPLPKYAVALANPRVEVPTAEVFRNFRLPAAVEIDNLSILTQAMIKSHSVEHDRDASGMLEKSRSMEHYRPGSGTRDFCFNVLERAAVIICPQVEQLKSTLLDEGAICASMSGSGPTVFGLFYENDAARRAASIIRSNGGWSVACEFI